LALINHIQNTAHNIVGEHFDALTQGNEPEKTEEAVKLRQDGYYHVDNGAFIPHYAAFTVKELQNTVERLRAVLPELTELLMQYTEIYMEVAKNHMPPSVHEHLGALTGLYIDTSFVSCIVNQLVENRSLVIPQTPQPLMLYFVKPETNQ